MCRSAGKTGSCFPDEESSGFMRAYDHDPSVPEDSSHMRSRSYKPLMGFRSIYPASRCRIHGQYDPGYGLSPASCLVLIWQGPGFYPVRAGDLTVPLSLPLCGIAAGMEGGFLCQRTRLSGSALWHYVQPCMCLCPCTLPST